MWNVLQITCKRHLENAWKGWGESKVLVGLFLSTLAEKQQVLWRQALNH